MIKIPQFIIGVLAASYLQNQSFRRQVDNAIKNVINRGVDTLNKAGNPPRKTGEDEENED